MLSHTLYSAYTLVIIRRFDVDGSVFGAGILDHAYPHAYLSLLESTGLGVVLQIANLGNGVLDK